MSTHGATLQNFNAELVRSLEGIKERRDNLIIDIQKKEEKRNELQSAIENLKYKLEELNESLNNKLAIRNEFEKTISNTETAYLKILSGSQSLLAILKREESELMKKIQVDS